MSPEFKGQLISKGLFGVCIQSNLPKNKRIFLRIFALAVESKNSRTKSAYLFNSS